jgi:hypothetical protein
MPVCKQCKKYSNCLTVDFCEFCGEKDWDTALFKISAPVAGTSAEYPQTAGHQNEGTVDDMDDRVADATDRIEAGLERVEAAIKEKWAIESWLVPALLVMFFWSVPGDIWHSRWRYALTYSIPSSEVYVQKKPHDCNFLASPLGAKYCDYERVVMITRWAKSTTGNPIESYDGKTWSAYTPSAGDVVPQYSTVKQVIINWEKKED